MKIEKLKGVDGYILALSDSAHIIFTDVNIKVGGHWCRLYHSKCLVALLYGDDGSQFIELWEAINPVVRPHK